VMKAGNCATCMYWKPYDWHDEAAKHGGWCNSPKIGEFGSVGYEADALVYSYNEQGRFWTGPDFGCVNHEVSRS